MYRADLKSNNCIHLKKSVLADDLESELITKYDKQYNDLLCIDFKDASYVDLATLMVLTSTISQRQHDNVETVIGLPNERKVRDFFKAWRYEEALLAATGIGLESITLDDDKSFFNEEQTTYNGQGEALEKLQWNPDWDRHITSKRNFFEFTTFSKPTASALTTLEKNISENTPRFESQRWNSPLIQEVLKKHLRENSISEEIARVIIYEAMSNAVRHPDSNVIQVASRFYKPSSTKSNSNLLISIWDDGETIANTLLAVLKENRPIRTQNLPSYMQENILCQKKDFGASDYIEPIVISESHDVNRKTEQLGRLLVFSTFPGVSRHAGSPAITKDDSQKYIGGVVLERGMGLYALRRTVVDQFQGNVNIRSGQYFIRIGRPSRPLENKYNARYLYRIKEYPPNYKSFKGNLININLPIRDYEC